MVLQPSLVAALRILREPTNTQILNKRRVEGILDFQAPPPIPKFIETVEAIDELPSYDSFEPSLDAF